MINIILYLLISLTIYSCQDSDQNKIKPDISGKSFPNKKVYDKDNKLIELNNSNKLKKEQIRNPDMELYDRKINIKVMDYCNKYRNESILKMPSQCLGYFLHIRKRNPNFHLNLPKHYNNQKKLVSKNENPNDAIAFMGKNFLDVKGNDKATHYDLKREDQDKRCFDDNQISTYVTDLYDSPDCDVNDLISGKLAVEYVKSIFKYVETKDSFRQLFEQNRFDEIKLMCPVQL